MFRTPAYDVLGERLSPEQRAMVEEYLARWRPSTLLKSVYPGTLALVRRLGMTDEEVDQIGAMGALKAAKRYSPDHPRRAAFGTVAHQYVRSAVQSAARITSVDYNHNMVFGDYEYPDGDDGWDYLGVSDGTEREVEEADRLRRVRDSVMDGMRFLPPRERQVIELRFGLDGDRRRTLAQVAKVMGVTRERVRQLEGSAMHRMQKVVKDVVTA